MDRNSAHLQTGLAGMRLEAGKAAAECSRMERQPSVRHELCRAEAVMQAASQWHADLHCNPAANDFHWLLEPAASPAAAGGRTRWLTRLRPWRRPPSRGPRGQRLQVWPALPVGQQNQPGPQKQPIGLFCQLLTLPASSMRASASMTTRGSAKGAAAAAMTGSRISSRAASEQSSHKTCLLNPRIARKRWWQ